MKCVVCLLVATALASCSRHVAQPNLVGVWAWRDTSSESQILLKFELDGSGAHIVMGSGTALGDQFIYAVDGDRITLNYEEMDTPLILRFAPRTDSILVESVDGDIVLTRNDDPQLEQWFAGAYR